MSFFGKFKNQHCGPPAPPKRIDNNAALGWPEDEFDEEDGDTYEAPPCERPAIKVDPRQMQGNVYLERSPAPIPSRPPRPVKPAPVGKAPKPGPCIGMEETYIDPHIKPQPPQVNRKEKPGKKPPPKKAPPSKPAPCLATNFGPSVPFEEDVYLDPNEGQGDGDDLYLEPHEACAPSPGVAIRMPPSLPKTLPCEGPPLMMKPPVPRAKSNLHLPSNAPEVKSPPFLAKRPIPTPVSKPPPSSSLKSSCSAPTPPAVESPTGGKAKVNPTEQKSSLLSESEESQLLDMEWFAGNCDRKEAEAVLYRVNKDGAFLVRHSSAQNSRQPYTLVVLYKEKVYNIPVRFLEVSQSYALGKEGKKNEELFSSLLEIISHHKINPILLIDSKSQAKNSTFLTYATRPCQHQQ